MERRTVDGVDKQRDAQRARSRASGAENNPINTTGDPAAAAGGHVGGRAKLWCGERAASGRVASSRPCHVVQRAISAAMFMGDPPKTFGIGFGLWTGRYKLLGLVTDVTDVRYGYCCLALQRFTFWKHDPESLCDSHKPHRKLSHGPQTVRLRHCPRRRAAALRPSSCYGRPRCSRACRRRTPCVAHSAA